MSKAARSAPSMACRDDPDAISLQTTSDDFEYHDASEFLGLPPSYADSEAESSSSRPPIRHVPPPDTRTDHNVSSYVNGKPKVCDTVTLLEPRYDVDPEYLEQIIKTYAKIPPVPYIYITGKHRETHRNGDKKETRDITDFRLILNLQRYLNPSFNRSDTSTMSLLTVENTTKTHRGTILKSRAPGAKQDIEVGSTAKPSLTEWCHRYCASPRMLRIFRLHRTVTGLDTQLLKNRLEGLIRSTNYRGHISIHFPVEDENIDFYTSNWINHWRLTKWICWLFYLSLLWLLTWPFLFFATKRYAIVRAEWAFSSTDGQGNKRYTTLSEEAWFKKWHVAIRRLALDRYKGLLSENVMNGIMATPADPPTPDSTGHAEIDSTVGLLTQGFQVARAIQGGGGLLGTGTGLQVGWGYDN